MSKVVSNRLQLSRLAELMNENLDMARGICTKSTCIDRWEKIAEDINKLGPPYRKWDKWQRVWIDMKCKKKRKLGFINPDAATVDNEDLVDIDEVVSGILQLDAEDPPPPLAEEPKAAVDDKASDGYQSEKSKSTHRKKSKRHHKSLRNERLALLEAHIANRHEFQDKLLDTIDDMSESLRYIEYFQRKKYFLKKEKLAIYKQYIKNKEHNRKYRTELKEQMLELKNIKHLRND